MNTVNYNVQIDMAYKSIFSFFAQSSVLDLYVKYSSKTDLYPTYWLTFKFSVVIQCPRRVVTNVQACDIVVN